MAGLDKSVEKLGFKENLKGKFTPLDLLRYLLLLGVIGFSLLIISWLLYPPENNYSIMKDTISFLGSSDSDNNPQGWWLFSIALIFLGVFLIPISLYRYNRLSILNKPAAALSFLFYLIASLGLILVALFPDNGGKSYYSDLSAGSIHNQVSILGFGGFGLAILIDFFIFLYDKLKTKQIESNTWIYVYIVFFSVVAMTIYTQVTWDIICESNCWPGVGIYSFPLWEWIIFYTLFFVLYAIILTLTYDIKD